MERWVESPPASGALANTVFGVRLKSNERVKWQWELTADGMRVIGFEIIPIQKAEANPALGSKSKRAGKGG